MDCDVYSPIPTDEDECSDGSAQCEHECIDIVNGTANSYQCVCGKGFTLSQDQHSCTGERYKHVGERVYIQSLRNL